MCACVCVCVYLHKWPETGFALNFDYQKQHNDVTATGWLAISTERDFYRPIEPVFWCLFFSLQLSQNA